MSAIAIIVAAIVGVSPGSSEPTDRQWQRCNEGALESRLEGCEAIAGDLQFSRDTRAFAAASVGDLYLEVRQAVEASAAYSRAINLSPEYGYPYRRRGFAHFLQDLHDKALADYDRAIELTPLDPYAYVSRASYYRQTGNTDKARSDVERALKLDLENSDLYYERGLLSLDVRDYQQAELDFRKALVLTPQEHDARYNLANALRHQSRTDEALNEIDAYIASMPNDPQGHRMRGWLMLDLASYDEAGSAFEAALKLSPDDASLQYALGYVHWRKGDYRDALARYQDIEADYDETGYYFYERGYARFMLNQDRLALDDAERALELSPDDVDALWLKGAALLYLEDYPQAVETLNGAAEIAPDNVDILILRARVQIASAHFYAAIGDLSRVLELQPDNYAARIYRGYASGLAGHEDRARQILDEAIEDHPDSYLAYELSARLLYSQEDYSAASRYSAQLVDLAPNDAGYRALHGDIVLGLEDYSSAYEAYRIAIDASPEPQAGWLRLGAYSAFRADDKANAMKLLQRARSADPDNAWTRGMLADLWLEELAFDKAAQAYANAIAGTDDEDELASYRFGKAKADAGAGRYEEALKALTVLAKQQPDDAEISWERAKALRALGRRDEAIVEFENFRERKPNSPDAHYALIDLMIEAAQYEEALRLADRLVGMEGEKAAAYRARARVQLGRADYQAAADDLDLAIGFDPDNAELHALRARAASRAGDAAIAVASSRRAVELAPQRPDYRLLLAGALLDRGEPAAALAELDQAQQSGQETGDLQFVAQMHLLKARALRALGDEDAAASVLDRAEAVSGTRPVSRTAGLRSDGHR
jgi:tetratricopeptide (TPR) repeat protein